MQPNVIVSIVTIFLATLFSILVLISDYRSKINRYFALLGSTLIFWILANLLADTAKDVSTALFWSKSAIIWPTFFPLLFTYLIIKLYYNDHWKKYKKIIILFSIISAFIIILSPTHFNIERVVLYQWGADYQPGILYYLLFIYLFISFGWAFYLLINISRLSIEPHRSQARFMLTGTLLAVSFSIVTNIILPLLNYGFASIFGPPNVLFFLGFTAYAITKHHLFNIKTIATELLTFAIWIAVLFDLLTQETWKGRLIEGGLFIFVIVFGILLIKSVLKEVHQREKMEELSKELEKLNFQLNVRTQQLTSLKDFTTSLIKTLDFKEIIQIIVNGIVERFNYAGVFLTGITEDGKYLYPLAISQNKPVELALKLLPKKLEEYREEIENNPSLASQAIQTNSIQINEDFGKFFSAVPSIMLKGMQSLIGFKSALAIPVISKGKALGVLNVAILKSEKEIGISELELLNTIANQIAIVLTNAKLFQQIEEANEKLIELDKAKAGMYSFVSHQIKAPIGIVKGFAQLLLDDSYGKLPKKAKERVEDMKKSCDRLIQLVNDFLDLRRIEEGRMEYEFKEINLVDLVKSVFEELKFLAEQKKLEFTLECNTDLHRLDTDLHGPGVTQTNINLTQTDTDGGRVGLLYEDLTYKIRGIIFKVKKELGLGHKENIYQKALEKEFKDNGILFEKEKIINIKYDEEKIGTYRPDFVIEDKVILEIKALPIIAKFETEQVWHYLKGSSYKLALLVNFGRKDVEIKRVINGYDIIQTDVDKIRTDTEKSPRESVSSQCESVIIKADEQRLRQVIQNLIENSIKYTEKGFVKVTITRTNMDWTQTNTDKILTDTDKTQTNTDLTQTNKDNGPRESVSSQRKSVIIKVEDSGMGIKPDVLPQLFDQFKRAKEAKLIQGTGLGLYIAREIVKAHKGEIWTESEGEGKGSRFYVKLKTEK